MDTVQLKTLHKLAFGDGDGYTDFFFDTRYRPENCFTKEINGSYVSVVHARKVNLSIFGKGVYVPFLTGVATHPDHRGHGYASELVKQAVKTMKNRGYPLVLLHPFNVDFYRKIGFECVNHKTDIVIDRYVNNPSVDCLFSSSCPSIAEILTPMLYVYLKTAMRSRAYAVRTAAYFSGLIYKCKEDNALGCLILKNGIPNGYVLIEDGKITEYCGEDISTLYSVRQFQGMTVTLLGGETPYGMAAAANIECLIRKTPFKPSANGSYVFETDNERYALSVKNGKLKTFGKTDARPDCTPTAGQLAALALGNGKKYAESLPEGFTGLFADYDLFLYDKY